MNATSESNRDFDIAIVGAGPVGLLLFALLKDLPPLRLEAQWPEAVESPDGSGRWRACALRAGMSRLCATPQKTMNATR